MKNSMIVLLVVLGILFLGGFLFAQDRERWIWTGPLLNPRILYEPIGGKSPKGFVSRFFFEGKSHTLQRLCREYIVDQKVTVKSKEEENAPGPSEIREIEETLYSAAVAASETASFTDTLSEQIPKTSASGTKTSSVSLETTSQLQGSSASADLSKP